MSSDRDGIDAIKDYIAEHGPYLHHPLSYRQVMEDLFPDAVPCPVAPADPEATPSSDDASGSQEPTHLRNAA